MTVPTALIAMSGGVDSSVAASLMCEAGYACIGGTMRLFDEAILPESACCSRKDVADAENVARRLGFPFYVFDFSGSFREKVIEHFVGCYEQGGTPNPCIECNRHLKFSELLRKGEELGCGCVVTGHYARICRDEASGRYLLYRAVDKSKDQSYFLYSLTQSQLSRVRLPLGELTKEEVRAVAEEKGLVNARKKDSQDICFIPDGDYVAFMERYRGKKYPRGNYLDLQGRVLGQHNGAAGYTIGQRKGLGIALGAPAYVCAKDMQANTVTLGPNEALFHRSLRARDWNWFPFPALTEPLRVMAKVRYRHTEQPATVYPEENGFARVEFDAPQRAVTPGQAVVLYDGDRVIGGGTITEVL